MQDNSEKSISEQFTILNRLEKALMKEYVNMSDDDILTLNKEIKEVTESNCSYTKYCIAKSLENTVSDYCKRYLV